MSDYPEKTCAVCVSVGLANCARHLKERLDAAEKVCEAAKQYLKSEATGLIQPIFIDQMKQALSDYQAKFGGRSDGQ